MTKFSETSESRVTRAIMQDFSRRFQDVLENDVTVVGAGPSGLVASMELAKAGYNVLLLESNNYLGGGFWIGGYLMNGVTVRNPAQRVLDEIGCPYKEVDEGLYLTPGPHACSKLIAATMDAGVTPLNMTRVDDVVLRENNRVAGVVINWSPVAALPRAISCVDPVAVEAALVIDATGHEAIVAECLKKRGIIETKGESGMWINTSEALIVENTCEVHPGLIVTGMSVATVFGVPRMGPTFGGMLESGKRAAELAKEILTARGAGKEAPKKVLA